VIVPELVQIYILYPPSIITFGLPVVFDAAVYVSAYLIIATPFPPFPPLADPAGYETPPPPPPA
jgi:hypothetical protein